MAQIIGKSLTHVWHKAIEEIIRAGAPTSPRGQDTLELACAQLSIDSSYCVLISPERKLNYRFMAAEAFWILSGDNRVETIAPYNPNIAQFSDDGVTFWGAYGPRIIEQLQFLIDRLRSDLDTRQAVIEIWRPSPPLTKDVPCTIAVHLFIRDKKMHAHVIMRSSDAWLGLPYDAFNFCMLIALVTGRLNELRFGEPDYCPIVPGRYFLTASSFHLYDRNVEDAARCLRSHLCRDHDIITNPMPLELYIPSGPQDRPSQRLINLLRDLRETKRGDPRRWWEGGEYQ